MSLNNSFLSLPDNLPVPKDDGAANHLTGLFIPSIHLKSTNGKTIDISTLTGLNVIFCYPMTGVPNIPLPPGWDDIPGARGCTPQACSYRDAYPKLKKYVNNIFGLSTQSSEYQKELKDRLELPYEILSDVNLEFQKSLNLPTFEVLGNKLLKRLTLLVHNGRIENVHYPVFPSNQDIVWVMEKIGR